MVFQSYALYPTMTVRENMSFGLRDGRMPKAEIERRVARAADLLQISELLDRKPASCRAASASAWRSAGRWCATPQVFLFDEPLSNLDAKLRTELRVEIKRLHQRARRDHRSTSPTTRSRR